MILYFSIFVFWSLSPDNGPGLDRDCIGHRPAWYIFSIFVFLCYYSFFALHFLHFSFIGL